MSKRKLRTIESIKKSETRQSSKRYHKIVDDFSAVDDGAINIALQFSDHVKIAKIIDGMLWPREPREEKERKEMKRSKNFSPGELIRFATIVCPQETRKFLNIPFKVLKRCAKNISIIRVKIIQRISKDNLNSVVLLLKEMTKKFKKFVELAKLCISLFDVVATRKNKQKFYSFFGDTCLECRASFFCETTGLCQTMENYKKIISNVDLEILNFFERYFNVEHIFYYFQGLEKLANKI